MKSGFPTQVPNEFKTRHGKNYNGRYANIIDNTEKIAWEKKTNKTTTIVQWVLLSTGTLQCLLN